MNHVSMEGLLEEVMKSVLQQQHQSKKPSKQSSGVPQGSTGLNVADILSGLTNGDIGGISELVDQLKGSPLSEFVQALEKDMCMGGSDPVTGTKGSPKKKDNIKDSQNSSAKQQSSNNSSMINTIPQDIRITFPVDIREMETSCIVYAEIPGADKSSIILEIENDALVIIATKVSYPLGSDEFPCVERSKGVYTRSVKLPHSVDTRNVPSMVAKYIDGVLSIKMPKVNKFIESTTRRILVQ